MVSLLTDVSSEMLYPIVPLYLTGVLGAPMAVVGLVEGLAEGTASLLKAVSGRISDRVGRRLPFVVGGYGLSALAKPLLALASSWPLVLAARLIDRTGKGIRGPARDAIIAATTHPAARGRAFGIHRALDTVGGIAGPTLGAALLALGTGYRALFLIAFLPAAMSVALTLGVREPEPAAQRPAGRLRLTDVHPQLRRFLAVVALFSLGNSSNAFLLLRARELGWSEPGVLGLYVLYNCVYAAAALPLGALSDRVGRRGVILFGFAAFAVAYAGLAAATAPLAAPLLLAVYGLYAATTGGAMRALVADAAGTAGAATAQGLFQTISGVGVLLASLLTGWLWQLGGAGLALGTSAAIAAAACLAFALVGDPGRATER